VVRFSALHGAIQHGKLSLSLLEKLWGLPIPLAYRKALGWLLMGVDTGAVSPARIARLLLQQPLRVRQTAYFALAQQRTNPWVERLRSICVRREPDTELRQIVSPQVRSR
ncbi:MAG: hypothetical protein RMK93_08825, partial [Bacteroidota bacterium]|nr:hypothetical protein [Bacteroidota bacterium]